MTSPEEPSSNRTSFRYSADGVQIAGEPRYTTVDEELACRLEHPVQEFSSLRDVPTPIMDDLLSYMRVKSALAKPSPPIADRNQDFNGSDAARPGLSFRRFMRGGHVGNRWFVWYEHGGIVSNRNIVLYDFSNRSTPRLLAKLVVFHDLCAQTDQLLGGDLPPARDFAADANW
jgi:hypothetical protein